MSGLGRYITTLVILVVAAFFIGLVVGVNAGSTPEIPAIDWTHVVSQNPEPDPKPIPSDTVKPVKHTQAPDFSLVKPETGETVELKDFTGSNILLFIATAT